MDPTVYRAYREVPLEQQRTADLLALVPPDIRTVLDIGARDGFFSECLAEPPDRAVTALDLLLPVVEHPRVECVVGDASALQFPDASFDLVFCAEVLEHVPSALLERACAELVRVSRRYLLIGVPYRQDLRFGRTTCPACGRANPPWGHVNSFDDHRLGTLFPGCTVQRRSLVGSNKDVTNALSAVLMDFAGNPYGTWSSGQCVHCGSPLGAAPERNFMQKVATKAAHELIRMQQRWTSARPNWIHLLLQKPALASA